MGKVDFSVEWQNSVVAESVSKEGHFVQNQAEWVWVE